MLRYIIVRLAQSAITLIGVSIIVFSFFRASVNPFDYLVVDDVGGYTATEWIIEFWALDEPWHVQYFTFVKNAVRGEFGPALKWQGRTAMELTLHYLPQTLQLCLTSIGVSVLLAVPIGVMSAVKKGMPFDTAGRLIAQLGLALPSFWLAILLVWIFAVEPEWFLRYGSGGVSHMVLPVVALGWFPFAVFVRMVRSSMINALDSDYIKLARIMGLPEWKVIWKHALSNAAIPPLAAFGAVVAGPIGFSIVAIETVFAWPGVGLLVLQAVNARDYYVAFAVITVVSLLIIGMNLLIDILRAYLDPRLRYA